MLAHLVLPIRPSLARKLQQQCKSQRQALQAGLFARQAGKLESDVASAQSLRFCTDLKQMWVPTVTGYPECAPAVQIDPNAFESSAAAQRSSAALLRMV